MFLTRISVRHPVFATMMMVLIMVVGLFSVQRLGVDQYPRVDLPVVAVVTSYPGASPETVEKDVSREIEEAINSLSGLDNLTSTSDEGRSMVIATFKLEIDGQQAAQDVRDRVSALEARLPDGVEKPLIRRFNPSDQPILSIAISSDTVDLPELTTMADNAFVQRFNVVPGVGQVDVVGGQSRQINLLIDKVRIDALSISVDDLVRSIQSQNTNYAAGTLVRGLDENNIQVSGRIENPLEFMNLIVSNKGGKTVYLHEIADYEDGAAEPTSSALLNGTPALAINIVKNQEANTVQVAKDAKSVMDRLNEELAKDGIKLRVISDNSLAIEESVEQVQSTLIEGALLAISIVFLFLGSWRSTVITGLTLPISIIGTFAVIYALGFTLNTMSLLALTLSIGILVDDAIVVRENIMRHLHMGKNHFKAAEDGTNEIGLAVLATTATIVAVFLPVAFMEGMIGRMFYQFGVTVSVAVLISLFVSFTLDPMLSSVWYDPDARPDAKKGPLGRAIAKFDAGFERLTQGYTTFIGWTLNHRFLTLSATVGVFVGSLFMIKMVGVEFAPTADQGRFQVSITAPVNSSLEYTTAKVRQVEKALHEFPEVASTYATINSGRSTGKNKAQVNVELVSVDQRVRTPVALAKPVRDRLALIPGIDVSVIQEGIGGRSKPIQVSLMGNDGATLQSIAASVMRDMEKIPGLVEIESTTEETRSVIGIKLKPEAASDLGVTNAQLGAIMRPLISGSTVSTWTSPEGNSYDVVMRMPNEQRSSEEDLMGLLIVTSKTDENGNPRLVRLDQVAEIVTTESPAQITRKNMAREVKISANVAGATVGEATEQVTQLIQSKQLPTGYRFDFAGESRNMQNTVGPMISALGMAVIFIYIVLASQFGSFLQPIAIMAALPLSLIGVILGLWLWGSTFNMFSLIGFIMLMGLVTKNGILLVDFVNQETRRGTALNEALQLAGTIRFRPIVMTTLAMIFGMLPLGLAMSGGGAQRAPMAHAVIGGLISSTILTLVVVPVIVSYLDAASRFAKSYFKHPDEEHHA